MLVDLGRNDLGKISKILKPYRSENCTLLNVSPMLCIGSTVRGEIDEKHDALDAIEAVLPAGTLSGAPEDPGFRQLIGELENNKRGNLAAPLVHRLYRNMDTL